MKHSLMRENTKGVVSQNKRNFENRPEIHQKKKTEDINTLAVNVITCSFNIINWFMSQALLMPNDKNFSEGIT